MSFHAHYSASSAYISDEFIFLKVDPIFKNSNITAYIGYLRYIGCMPCMVHRLLA